MFTRIKIVPRWIIFLLDLGSCVLSLFIASLIGFNFEMGQIKFQELYANLLSFLLINTAIFFFLKTYSGIIRYTSAQDMLHI